MPTRLGHALRMLANHMHGLNFMIMPKTGLPIRRPNLVESYVVNQWPDDIVRPATPKLLIELGVVIGQPAKYVTGMRR